MGNVLKERREELGKNIKEIAKITRVRANYLKAIEEEEFSTLPIPVYTKGYIKEYAKFLGVPVDLALAPYERYLEEINAPKDKRQVKKDDLESSVFDKQVRQEQPEIVVPEKIDTPAKTVSYSEPGESQPSRRFSPSKLLWLIPLSVIIFTYYIVTSQKGAPPVSHKAETTMPMQKQETEQPKEVQLSELAKPAEQPQKDQIPKEQPKTEPVKAADESTQPQKRKHVLDITAIEKVQVQLIIDGSEKKEMTLNAGDKMNFTAYRSFDIKADNAASIKLKFNGKEVKNIGNAGGQVKLNLPEPKPSKPANSEKVKNKQKEEKTVPSSDISIPQQAPQSNP
jgi:cytoskeletal protein RodZ